jgi:hypothetical protein
MNVHGDSRVVRPGARSGASSGVGCTNTTLANGGAPFFLFVNDGDSNGNRPAERVVDGDTEAC